MPPVWFCILLAVFFTVKATQKFQNPLSHWNSEDFGILFHQPLGSRGQASSDLNAPLESINCGKAKQVQQSTAKQQAGNKPAAVRAFIEAHRLHTTVKNHGHPELYSQHSLNHLLYHSSSAIHHPNLLVSLVH